MKKIFILFILFLNVKNIEATNDNDSKENLTEEIKEIQGKNEEIAEFIENLKKTEKALNPSNQ